MSAYQLAYSSDARLAANPGGDSTLQAGTPTLAIGGAEYDPDPVYDQSFCQTIHPDGRQCGARPVKGEPLCVGHKRSLASASQE